MSRPSITQVGQALLTTVRAGTYDGAAIRAGLTDGAEVRLPQVVVRSPSVGFEVLEEGFLVSASEWLLILYSANGREANVGVEIAFFDAVVAALAADVTLGGVVTMAYPEGVDEPVAMDSPGDEPTKMFRREMRIHVDH